MTEQIVEIDIVSDVMCPWCYVGKRRLEKALTMVDGSINVKVRWRPYQLDPTIPDEGRDRKVYLANKFGSPEQIAQVYQPITDAGKAEGIAFNFDGITLAPNTLNAHRLIKWAETYGLQDEMSERLFKAFFIENLDLTKDDTLVTLAKEVGLEESVIRRLLEGDADTDAVRQEIAHYQQMGVRSVPTMIVGGKYAIVGAREPETIAEVITGVSLEQRGLTGEPQPQPASPTPQ